ncbi:hypothetical protein EDC01DRAFT_763384 [Geopyxis carbonaria]|nr:hypothetical protein EDC01DRAFT_763384 [Geopyxis carbonaria]
MAALSAYSIEGWTVVSISILLITLRLIARVRSVGVHGLAADDYLMACVAILFPAECTMSYYTGYYGGTNNMPPAVRAGLTDAQVERLESGALYFYVGWLIYPLMLWIMKFCMIFFYRRLTLGLWQQKVLWHITWICAITYVGGLVTILFSCRPIQRNWQVRPDPGILCTQGWTFYGVTGTTNLLTDLLLFTIPLPLILRARLPLRKKLGLLIMFSMGLFVMLATVLRHVMIFRDVYAMESVAMWAVRETFVACIVGNAPMIKPMWTDFLVWLGWRRKVGGSGHGYGKSGSSSGALGAGGSGMMRSGAASAMGGRKDLETAGSRGESRHGGITKTTTHVVTSEPFDGTVHEEEEGLKRDGLYFESTGAGRRAY